VRAAVVACQTIEDEVGLALERSGLNLPVSWVESGLHNLPDKLRVRVQEEIDGACARPETEQVLLAFGACGNSLVGVTARDCALVIPRIDDCISLLLGSMDRRHQLGTNCGTYFLTRGWLENERNLEKEYRRTVKLYGEERARRLFKKMLSHYSRAMLIDTGAYDVEASLTLAQLFASTLDLRLETVRGTVDILERLFRGDWDNEFIVLEPGETLALNHFLQGGRGDDWAQDLQ